MRGIGEIYSGETVPETFSRIKSAYPLGEDSRFLPRLRGVNAAGSGADWHYASESVFFRAIERARQFDLTNMIVGQAVNRVCDNVLQEGLVLDPDTGDDKLDADLSERWDAWRMDPGQCDIRGAMPFEALTWSAMRAMQVDGDALGLLTDQGKLQVIEAHRLRTPKNTAKNVVHGVLIDELTAEPLEYWVTKKEIGVNGRIERVSDMIRIKRRNEAGELVALHLFNPKRISQSRGISVFLPVTFPISLHDDVQFAALVQQQTVSCVAILRNIVAGGAPMAAPEGRGLTVQEVLTDGSTRTVAGLSPGMEVIGRVGETVSLASPNVPSPTFKEHAELVLSIIAVNLGIPLAVLLLDPSKTNFSGWRGAIDQARYGFRKLQGIMRDQWYTPVYRWQLSRWIAADAALAGQFGTLGAAIYKHKFNAPRWAYIEPLKDAQGDDLKLQKAHISPRRWCAERLSLDWGSHVREVFADRKEFVIAAIKTAEEINQELKTDVTWRELCAWNWGEKSSEMEGDDENAETSKRPNVETNQEVSI